MGWSFADERTSEITLGKEFEGLVPPNSNPFQLPNRMNFQTK